MAVSCRAASAPQEPAFFAIRYSPGLAGQPVTWQAIWGDARGVLQRSAGVGDQACAFDLARPEAAADLQRLRERLRAAEPRDATASTPRSDLAYDEYWIFWEL